MKIKSTTKTSTMAKDNSKPTIKTEDDLKPSLFKRILWTLFPRHLKCVCCGQDLPERSEYAFCDNCERELPLNNANVCMRCGVHLDLADRLCLGCKANKSNYKTARAPLRYIGMVPKLIRGFKYDNKQYLSNVFGRYMLDTYLMENWSIDLIIPVPLYVKRKKKRGYNQAQLLAEYMSEKTKIPLLLDNLIRTKDTPTQVKLTYKQRVANLRGAFSVLDKSQMKSRTVLLIDDVLTTTATANECSEMLLKAGAKEVFVLAVARAEQKVPMQGNTEE